MNNIVICFLLSMFVSNSFAQLFSTPCATASYMSPQNASTMNNFNSSNNSSKIPSGPVFVCVRVYFHVVRKDDGTGGQTATNVNTAFNYLINDFGSRNISFNWNNNIDYINNTSLFNNPSITSVGSLNTSSNGIDIYLFGDNSPAISQASAMGGSQIVLGGSQFFSDGSIVSMAISHIISHEMGHIFSLYHTHHGTTSEAGDPNQCAELYSGLNSSTCGDYITDTPADPNIRLYNQYISCTNWVSTVTDANGHLYSPSLNNIISYTNVGCMTRFSFKQGARMRYALMNIPSLQNKSVYSFGALVPIGGYTACSIAPTNVITFPNPANTELNLVVENNLNKVINYTLFDMNNFQIASGSFSTNEFKISTSTILSGNYILYLAIDIELIIKTIIIKH